VHVEVLGVTECVVGSVEDEPDKAQKIIERRTALALVYATLPVYASAAFWLAVESADMALEVLVRVLRVAVSVHDQRIRDRLVAILIHRTQGLNESWAYSAVRHLSLQADERHALVGDLCADLHERMLRAWLDPGRTFWEENFLHCLYFERKHAYHAVMIREGWWQNLHARHSTRIPRTLLSSLERLVECNDGSALTFDIEDERAHQMLLSVERSDLLHLVLHLPDRLKAVVLLLFWEGRSAQDVASVLQISERTVRNRLQAALKTLRVALCVEGENHKDE